MWPISNMLYTLQRGPTDRLHQPPFGKCSHGRLGVLKASCEAFTEQILETSAKTSHF